MRTETSAPGLTELLHAVAREFHRHSGADLVSLVLYDDATRRYFAPVAIGIAEDSLRDSLPDMQAQLDRYLGDVAQHKVPDELHVPQYGSTVWLTVARRLLDARDAPAEIDSTFVRRHKVQSVLGLPLVAGDGLVGLVYLDYCLQPDGSRPRLPAADGLAEVERYAGESARAIQASLASAERAALEGTRRLISLLVPVDDQDGARASLSRHLSIALADVLLVSRLDAAAVYELDARDACLDLVTAHAPAEMPRRLHLPRDRARWDAAVADEVTHALAEAGLHATSVHALGEAEPAGGDDPAGYLVLLSRDPLAALRLPPTVEDLLRAAADLLGGALGGQRLISTLTRSNRLLGALSRMSSAMLRPGATRQQVLEAVVSHLTDASVTEFDFDFATVYLLDHPGDQGDGPDARMVVKAAAGTVISDAIKAAETDAGGNRVPRWALDGERELAADDVLAFVARSWDVVLVGAASTELARAESELLDGPLPVEIRWFGAPVVRDGVVRGHVAAGVIGRRDAPAGEARPEIDVPFTLAGEIFESSGHAELIRLFLPFGLDGSRPATGVLEVGYHQSHDRCPDWAQIEALRAAAAQVSVAVETARLYEEARRHAEQLELTADVSKAIASSIELDQTLRLVARNLVRLVDASTCQIALFEDDGEGWYGAAASDQEDLWRRQRGERPEQSVFFEVLDRADPLVIEDAAANALVPRAYRELFGIRSLLALPLEESGQTIGCAVLAQRGQPRRFTAEEVQRARGLTHQAAVAIKNARLHAQLQEEQHIQKDFVLVGLGQWGQRAYPHLQTLKQFFNFRIHVVERAAADASGDLAAREAEVRANGDTFHRDSAQSPARDQLARELEPSCYVITYIATPAATHLDMLARYYGLSDVVLIEKPLGASPDEYRRFLDRAPGGVEIVAADHYYFKLEVRLLQALLTEERTLRDFLNSVREIRIEILEEQPLTGAAAEIGVIADLVPHAFAIISLLTPIDRLQLDPVEPVQVARHEPATGSRETYARVNATFPYQGTSVRLVIDVGKGVENAKWIKLSGERRSTGRSPFYKFDFARGEAIDGTQSTVRAAVRKIREPGVPDNAHLTMLRHVIERRHPAVGILSIREAIRANQRILELQEMASELLASGRGTTYALGSRPAFARAAELTAEPP